jgi:biopolymer transport protein TolR
MERHHKRRSGAVALNIVSVIDIFTILVFFLLVHSADVDLPGAKLVRLPEASAEKQPRPTAAVIVVSDDDILVEGRKVAGTREVLADGHGGIPEVTRALEELSARKLRASTPQAGGPEVTIMAARELPFQLMKKVMLACTEAHYGQISFAVLHKSGNGGA